MGPIGVPEMLFILVVALLIFGPRRLPEMGRTIGKALGEFRRATTDLKHSIDVEMTLAEDKEKQKEQADRAVPAAVPRAPAKDDSEHEETADLSADLSEVVDQDASEPADLDSEVAESEGQAESSDEAAPSRELAS